MNIIIRKYSMNVILNTKIPIPYRTNTMKIFWNRTKAPNVGLIDHVEERLGIVTLLGVVFVKSRCT